MAFFALLRHQQMPACWTRLDIFRISFYNVLRKYQLITRVKYQRTQLRFRPFGIFDEVTSIGHKNDKRKHVKYFLAFSLPHLVIDSFLWIDLLHICINCISWLWKHQNWGIFIQSNWKLPFTIDIVKLSPFLFVVKKLKIQKHDPRSGL